MVNMSTAPSSSKGKAPPAENAGVPELSGQAATAMKTWQLANEVENDPVYLYNNSEDTQIRQDKPWTRDPQYFTDVRVSALALIKMVMHARSGQNLEVMGLVQGRISAHTLIIMDSFALPVEGTETRVNAQAQAYEYMSTYTSQCEELGRKDKVIGWYHSHPGYGCWLSGIDVSTQALHQQYQEPFVALVLDPVRTISAGKVDLGAFRTYPKGFKPADEGPSEYQPIPLNKIEDFGVHCKQYYQLNVTYFKSALDARLLNSLWNSYWVNTLSANALLTNAGYITSQIHDLSAKLEQAETAVARQTRFSDPMILAGGSAAESASSKRKNDPLTKCIRDSNKIVCEALYGLVAQNLKYALFAHRGQVSSPGAPMETDDQGADPNSNESPGTMSTSDVKSIECKIGELATAADALCEVNPAAEVAAELLA